MLLQVVGVLGVAGEQGLVFGLRRPQVLGGDGRADRGAVEDLEQDLDALALFGGGPRQPVGERRAAGGSDGVDAPVGPAVAGHDLGGRQPLRLEHLEDRVEVTVALAPEVAEAGLVDLADLIAGHRRHVQQAEHGVPRLVLRGHAPTSTVT